MKIAIIVTNSPRDTGLKIATVQTLEEKELFELLIRYQMVGEHLIASILDEADLVIGLKLSIGEAVAMASRLKNFVVVLAIGSIKKQKLLAKIQINTIFEDENCVPMKTLLAAIAAAKLSQ